ncbi:MAG TPA: hypothetical protein PLA43_04905 [Bryobacteraceae bacterium]|nr:hypothetical protein [Bryobacteraceae bacterium]HOL69828.1 hypothetical protein [Bryobacteraceae bacterium]HOQ45201.1 hypothetical protein [Bryobacteraceae bacterium]HPQ16021.1 hypothetical protein [Bryobacteraceae bacterium]HPU71273.1 hypothetical protein [Bryobacteraceae bacterium]
MSGTRIADELRRAVSAGLYRKAEGLLAELRRHLDSLPAGSAERETALQEAADLIEWARRVTLAARAAAAAQLANLAVLPAGYRPAAPERHTWEIVG